MIQMLVPAEVCKNILQTIQLNYSFEKKIWNHFSRRFERNHSMKLAMEKFRSRKKVVASIDAIDVLWKSAEFLDSWKERTRLALLSRKHQTVLLNRCYREILLTKAVLPDFRFRMWRTLLLQVA